MKPALPPHIAWPLFVVALLGMSLMAGAYTVVAAYSDGGPQVVEGYYETASVRHEAAQRRAAAEALGLHLRVEMQPGVREGLQTVVLVVADRAGAPVEGLRGTLTASRPHLAAPVATVPLQASAPGRYHMGIPQASAGLWDFHVEAKLGTTPFETTLRAELP